jgi:capsid protein
MPGANYNIIANDLEGVNYSSGRLGMLDERELWKLIQKFDIDVAERPIFENFLYMALLTGAIPLPWPSSTSSTNRYSAAVAGPGWIR